MTQSQSKPRRGGRPAAGTDAGKRQQILEGAGRVFSSAGFDAASMSDVAREADVSKATLYVYFQNKEQLFTSICAERRDKNINELMALLDRTGAIETVLYGFGSAMLRLVSDPFVVSAQRIVIGVVNRMPEIGTEFFELGGGRLALALADYIAHHQGDGRLQPCNQKLAAAQFLELCQATVTRPRLYGVIETPPSDAEIDTVIRSAVRVWLAAYGT